MNPSESACALSDGSSSKYPALGHAPTYPGVVFRSFMTSKKFEGLEFFKFDSTYVVTAQFKRVENAEWFNMKTTTDRVSKERVYGVLTFELKGEAFSLNVYQGQELMNKEGFEDYLFLPFLDETNGLESYGGGRYLDMKIPKSKTVGIDFNSAYNPYCAYNERFSCPVVPRVNYLKTRVEAGVKAFEKH